MRACCGCPAHTLSRRRVQVNAGHRLARPEPCPENVYAVMQECWAAKRDARPSFAVLEPQMKAIYEAA